MAPCQSPSKELDINKGIIESNNFRWKSRTQSYRLQFYHIFSLGYVLTHRYRVTHICVNKLTTIGSDNGLSPGPAPSRYLNQCKNNIDWTLAIKLQCVNRNFYIFIQENAFENIVGEPAATILFRPQCVSGVCRSCVLGSTPHGLKDIGLMILPWNL